MEGAIEIGSDSENERPMVSLKRRLHEISSDSETDELLSQPALGVTHNVEEPLTCTEVSTPLTVSSVTIEAKMTKKEKAAFEKQRRDEQKKEEKKKKEFEKAKQQTLKEAARMAKPGQCMKSMMVMISPGVIAPPMGELLQVLSAADIKYSIQPQASDNIVTFWREVTEVMEDCGQLRTERHETMDDTVLGFLSLKDFLSGVYNSHQVKQGLPACTADVTLNDLCLKVSRSFQGQNLKYVFIVIELEKYFNQHNNAKKQAYKKNVSGKTTQSKGSRQFDGYPEVSRLQVEQILLDQQMEHNHSFVFVESVGEACKMVKHFTKSVAEAPFKRDRTDGDLATFLDVSGSCKVSKDGHGLLALWRQFIQQFRNVTAEVANTIIADYPSPRDLQQAYLRCSSLTEAELLLQDLVVRRGAGVTATTRRIGKELSRKIYTLMTSVDPTFVIK